MPRFISGITCVIVASITLSLGLWPFHAPRNDVTWPMGEHGLRFGPYGTVMSSGKFETDVPKAAASCSVETWARAAHRSDSGTILSFYEGQKRLGMPLHQSGADVRLDPGQTGDLAIKVPASLYASEVFERQQPVFITATQGNVRMSLYVNGTLSGSVPLVRPAGTACTGRLVLGDGALQQDTWSGDIMGLAVYESELSPERVQTHYLGWIKNHEPDVQPGDRNVAIYRFREGSGNEVHNELAGGFSLRIPEYYTVEDQLLFEPIWQEFDSSWGFWRNCLKNVIGFVPLGFCFYAYVGGVLRARSAGLITVLSGAAVSVTIEAVQAFLPTRQSGTTDIITNTLGTYTGVLLGAAMGPYLAGVFRSRFIKAESSPP